MNSQRAQKVAKSERMKEDTSRRQRIEVGQTKGKRTTWPAANGQLAKEPQKANGQTANGSSWLR